MTFFFTEIGNKAACIICQEAPAPFKEYNVKSHFQGRHANFENDLSGNELQRKANDILRSLKQLQAIHVQQASMRQAAMKASFVLADNFIARNRVPFRWGIFKGLHV